MKIYLAYAIDQAGGSLPRELKAVRQFLRVSKGVTWAFEPGRAFYGVHGQPDSSIRAVTQTALHESDMVIAMLPRGASSVGVPMEIDSAVALGKQVLILSDAPSWMLAYDPQDVGARVQRYDRWGPEAARWLSRALSAPPEAREPFSVPEGPEVLPVALVGPGKLPVRHHHDDAGLDLIVSEARIVQPGSFVDIPCGVSIHLPDWSWGLITGRSSTLRKRGLLVNQGVIDAGYRGEMFAGVWNLTDKPVEVLMGERIAQLLIIENGTRRVYPVQFSELEPGSRGVNGFGSTGT